jgi:hypothetical protein
MIKNFHSVRWIATAVLVCCWLFASPAAIAEKSSPDETVTAYYFHGTRRCPTCNRLEQYAREAIEKHFAGDLADGRLRFQSVNIDRRENAHFVEDYQLYTRAVVLSQVKEGKEVRSKNLNKIWQLVRNKSQFDDYMRDEISAFLEEA